MGYFYYCYDNKTGKGYVNQPCPPPQQKPAVPANPAPPAPITPPTSANDINLAFTQSAYGGAIPIIFGSDLISGNVIWASPFVKKTYTDGDNQKFYYSVNIAIAICEGVIDNLLRVYCADVLALDNTMTIDDAGNPVPNSNGQVSTLTADLTSPTSPLVVLDPDARKTKITIFDGSPDQTPPQIMQQQEGYDYTPAYRGVAYLLLENFLIADSIPALTMEVSANTVSLYPRQSFDFAQNSVLIERTASEPFLARMPGYDVIFSLGQNADATSVGTIVTDNNTMTYEKESVFVGDDGLTFTVNNFSSQLLTSGSILFDRSAPVANGGVWTIWSPFYNGIVSEYIGVDFNSHNPTGPGGTSGGVSLTRGVDDDGITCDIVVIPSWTGTLAILLVYDDGTSQYVFHNNSAAFTLSGAFGLSYGGALSCGFNMTQAQWEAQKTFPDGVTSAGQHVYFISQKTTNDALVVDRLSYDSTADGSVSLAAPRLDKAVALINYDDLIGSGNSLSLTHMFACPSDNTFIVCCDLLLNNGGSQGLIFKWDPLHARIVWKTLFGQGSNATGGFMVHPGQWNSTQGAQDVSNDKFAWLSRVGDVVWSCDLTNGEVTREFALADQNLPTGIPGATLYNGQEDSLVYYAFGTDVLYKVFLSRANRAQVALSTIVKSLLQRVDWREADTEIQGIDTLAVDGYTIASSGYTLRQAFSELKQVFTFDIVESNGAIVYKQRGGDPIVSFAETKMQLSDGSTPWLSETHEYDLAGTRKISVTYRDVDREYKSNVQSVQLPKYSNIDIDADSAIQVQVPIVLDADTARKLAEILLYAKITYQTGYDGTLPQNVMVYDPSDVVTFKFNPIDNIDDVTMRVRQLSIGGDWSIKINGTREDPEIYQDQINLFGTLGRYTPQSIPQPPDRVDFNLLQIPFWTEAQAITQDNSIAYPAYLTLTSLRSSAKLPKDNIVLTVDGNTDLAVPPISAFPTWGFVFGNIGDHPEKYTTQFTKKIQVQIQSTSGALLGSCTDYYDMVSNRNKNLAVIGDELIQFQTATDLGNGVWELEVIARCLYGTEDAAANHRVGDKFILLSGADGLPDTNSISTVYMPVGDGMAKTVQVSMPSTKNTEQPALTGAYLSLQYRPFMPAAGKFNLVGSDLVVTWERRARYNGQWPDDGDEAGLPPFTDGNVTLDALTFDLYLTTTPQTFNRLDASSYLRHEALGSDQTFTYTAAMQTADGYVKTTELTAVVYQSVNKTGLDDSLGLSFSWGQSG